MAMPPGRPWAELQHDLLVAIMTRVGAPDLLSGGAPRACSSWRAAARDPLAWRRVDLRDWAALTSGRRAAGPGPSGARVPVHAALAGILDVAATLAEGRIEAVLLPEFADEITYCSSLRGEKCFPLFLRSILLWLFSVGKFRLTLGYGRGSCIRVKSSQIGLFKEIDLILGEYVSFVSVDRRQILVSLHMDALLIL